MNCTKASSIFLLFLAACGGTVTKTSAVPSSGGVTLTSSEVNNGSGAAVSVVTKPNLVDPATVYVYTTRANTFGYDYSDIFYVGVWGGPIKVSESITYYYDGSAVALYAPGTAPCNSAMRFTQCSSSQSSLDHYLTANPVGSSALASSPCTSGSPLAEYYKQFANTSRPAVLGPLGDSCPTQADGRCPAGTIALYWGIVADQQPYGTLRPRTTLLTSNYNSVYNNSAVNITSKFPAGCGPAR